MNLSKGMVKLMNKANNTQADLAQMSMFVVKQQYRGLTDRELASASSKKRLLSFNDLVHCACFPNVISNQKAMQEVVKDPSLLLQYEWILKRMSIAVEQAQVAASSDNLVSNRSNEQFTLEIKPDSSNKQQAYLLLSLEPSAFKSSKNENGLFLHCILKDDFKVIHFKHLIDGQAQIVLEKSGNLYAMLSNVNTKMYLC
jgi:hypothetical protein